MLAKSSTILILLAPLLASAQSCQPNIVMDHFRTKQMAFVDGLDRWVNVLGGDYGGANVTFDVVPKATDGYVSVVPANDKDNFFFFKANARACYDLSRFTGLSFDMVAPGNADFEFTMTQMAADCVNRINDGDSIYRPISVYKTPLGGDRYRVLVPLKAFDKNTKGSDFDYVHFKDFTFVNMHPARAEFQFYNFTMIGDCTQVATTTSTTSTATSRSTPTASTTVPAVGIASSSSSLTPFFSFFAFVAGLLWW